MSSTNRKASIAAILLIILTGVVAVVEWDLMLIFYVVGGVALLVGVFYLFFVWEIPKSWEPKSQSVGTPLRSFHTKVVGVTHRNADGSSRQKIIHNCSVGDRLELVREPDNHRDSNAIKVCWQGEQLGYISADIAFRLADEIDRGGKFAASISDLTGGTDRAPTRGVNIKIDKY
jgi:hypothetical protein